jgi:hypothetical protein
MIVKKQKTVCVVCGKEKSGIPIREDFVIRLIRKLKGIFKLSTGNRLVVCNEHIEEAKKRRERFEKGLLTYAGIGAVLGIILILINILISFDIIRLLQSLLLLILLVIVMALLSLYQYFPAMATQPAILEEAVKKVARVTKVKVTKTKKK